jgi:Domain of unknown function (DUF4157)/Predicted lipoprotein of unknown function (DUF2380)
MNQLARVSRFAPAAQKSRAPMSVGRQPAAIPVPVSDALQTSGMPLESAARSTFDYRFGHDFSNVRIHADEKAAGAAGAMQASAFTVGSHIVFGRNHYAPSTPRGRLLLLHELKHVEQQRHAAATAEPSIDMPSSAHEVQARSLLDTSVDRLAVQRIQCAPEDEEFSLGGGLVDRVGVSAFGTSAWPFLKAVFEGFVGGIKGDVKSGRAHEAKEHLTKLFVPWNAVKFYAGYLLGLVIGLVSPITDLVKGIIGVVKLAVSALEFLAKWSPLGVALSPERQEKIARLTEKFVNLSIEFAKAIEQFASDPKGTIDKMSGFLDGLMQLALGKARELGSRAAHSIFDFLSQEFYAMGKSIGEVIGSLIAQILLLVFSDAIGNIIKESASMVGKAAAMISGKAVEFFAWAKGFASEAMAAIRSAAKGALRVFEGLCDSAVEAFKGLSSLIADSEALDSAGEKAAAGVGKVTEPALSNVMESRMVTSTRTSPAKVADLRPPKVHPSNVGKEIPKPHAPTKEIPKSRAPNKAPLDVPEDQLTPDQLKGKEVLELFHEHAGLAREAAEEESLAGVGQQVRDKAGAGMKAKPKHHVMPQEARLRSWFEERGFVGNESIDKYTVKLEGSKHEAIHGGGDYKLARKTGFDWNSQVMKALRAEEDRLGERLTRPEILAVVNRVMRKYGIRGKFVPY